MESIAYLSIAQLIFSAVFLLNRNEKKQPDVFLIVWLVLLIFPSVILLMRIYRLEIPLLRVLLNPAHSLLYGPLMLFCAYSLTQERFKYTKKQLGHFIPFLLGFLFLSL
jgi:hypothetical protein